jgi:hypothetical protein
MPAGATAQRSPQGEEVNYPWVFTGLSEGFADNSVGDQRTRVLSIPASIWLRSLAEGRTVGVRLRLTGIFGVADFERVSDIDLESVSLGGVFPGIELLFPIGSRSMLRPYVDIGIGLTSAEVEELLLAQIGMRTEHVFPWNRWELGLEPRFQLGWGDASRELVDGSYAILGVKADARYPLGFTIGGEVPDIGAYIEPGWFPNGLQFAKEEGPGASVDSQFEAGVTLGFRHQAPKVWFVRVPRLGVGYRWGGGLTGLRIRIGGDRVTRLPLP